MDTIALSLWRRIWRVIDSYTIVNKLLIKIALLCFEIIRGKIVYWAENVITSIAKRDLISVLEENLQNYTKNEPKHVEPLEDQEVSELQVDTAKQL